MTEPAQKTDYDAQAVARVIEQYKRGPVITGLVRIFARRIAEREAATWEVILYRLMSNAEGAQLAALGRIVGADQNSLDDAAFRRLIAIRLLTIRSQGDPNTLEKIAALIIPTGIAWVYGEERDGTIRIHIDSVIAWADAVLAFSAINDARQGGVRFILTWVAPFDVGTGYRPLTFRRYVDAMDPTHGFRQYGVGSTQGTIRHGVFTTPGSH